MVPIRNDGKPSRCAVPITLTTDFIYIEISKTLRNVAYVNLINKVFIINKDDPQYYNSKKITSL